MGEAKEEGALATSGLQVGLLTNATAFSSAKRSAPTPSHAHYEYQESSCIIWATMPPEPAMEADSYLLVVGSKLPLLSTTSDPGTFLLTGRALEDIIVICEG